ncbi:putative ABC transporter ATP-binding protein [Gordonia hirsuta DSM 44140 = NBRC 16056]|uniref:Putative ABC transporter ATP-binding protein n=1 Tax=Gordonia hirsuta DSM 44140 = NBRC 16056 TaxID=1121927 RepID=L7L7G7_9ACTN|nr:metal ABC transporter ATP-binding protein [Gordonia hirsuta]GAC56879.1 putative ABC transporter ATP-binding protein [Gordonia hirsuta DSM 44140 = NBRC 16056]
MSARPVVSFSGATLAIGDRVLWRDLDLDVRPGEFVAVLGPNGSGKTTLLRTILGQLPLTGGSLQVDGRLGYVPQQHAGDSDAMALRGRDLVGFGVDGTSWGIGLRGWRTRAARVDDAVAQVGAQSFVDKPIGLLSGGEQQRLRVAQALTNDPDVLLCDEPLSSLDLRNQRTVVDLLDARRRAAGTAILFVTHEINPVLPFVDRVLYLVDGHFRVGTVDEVMNSATLSELYGSRIDVAEVGGRLVVIGGDGEHHNCQEHPYLVDGDPTQVIAR